jgi:hypothetical protein
MAYIHSVTSMAVRFVVLQISSKCLLCDVFQTLLHTCTA